MGGIRGEVRVYFDTLDNEDLGDMTEETVIGEVFEVVEKAVAKWYEERGKDLLHREPMVF